MSNEKRAGRPATLGDVWKVANELSANVEKALNNFQTDLISWQRKITATWNTVSVVVHALRKKGILTDEEVTQAGVEIWEMNARNMAKVKEAALKKEKVDSSTLEVDPITEFGGLINRGVASQPSNGVESKGHENQDTDSPKP